MKKKYILFLLTIITFAKAQTVNIPDLNFKAYLINNSEINTNGDNEIQISEAVSFTGTINVLNKNIVNLVGIESFVNITVLQCSTNKITSLDITKNVNLTSLYCFGNQLTNLDVSKNIKITNLWCGGNQLTNLEVNKNTELVNLYCEGNKLINLDLSKNNVLGALSCSGNLFTTLDLSKNTNFKWLYCDKNPLLTNLNLKNGNNTILSSIYVVENPNLACIQVDDINYANSQPSYLWQKDTTASYSTNCLLSTAEIEKPQIKIYPNPVKDVLKVSEEVSSVRISDFSGKIIKQISSSEKSINVSKLAKGDYIISATTKTGETINKKFIKE